MPPWARAARRAYSRKEAVAIYLTLKRAAALALPRGVDRGDASLFAEAGQARAPPRRRPRDPTALCPVVAQETLVRGVFCAPRLSGPYCVCALEISWSMQRPARDDPPVCTAFYACGLRAVPAPCGIARRTAPLPAGPASARICAGRARRALPRGLAWHRSRSRGEGLGIGVPAADAPAARARRSPTSWRCWRACTPPATAACRTAAASRRRRSRPRGRRRRRRPRLRLRPARPRTAAIPSRRRRLCSRTRRRRRAGPPERPKVPRRVAVAGLCACRGGTWAERPARALRDSDFDSLQPCGRTSG